MRFLGVLRRLVKGWGKYSWLLLQLDTLFSVRRNLVMAHWGERRLYSHKIEVRLGKIFKEQNEGFITSFPKRKGPMQTSA